MAEVITVTALNRYVKTLLDHNDLLYDVALRGEIANFVQNAKSGHCYFFLRDGQCSVKAVMFRSDARQLAFRPPGRDAGGGPLPGSPCMSGTAHSRSMSTPCSRTV